MAVIALACLPGAASAQRSQAPPGNSGVQEYVETLPDGSGKRATNDAGHAVKAPLPESGVVSVSTRKKLAGLGDAGSETAALAEATAPRPAARGASSQDTSEGDNGPVLSGIVRTAAGGDGDGMGVVLPLLMLVVLVGAAGYGLSRRQANR